MKLFFLRHGDAVQRAASDAERALSPRGESDVLQVVESRAEELAGLELIVTSPYRRAMQSAEIASRCLGYDGDLLVTEHLEPGGELQALIRFTVALNVESLLLVTHQPLMGKILRLLSGDNIWLSAGTANLVALEAEVLASGCAEVCWSAVPG